MSRLLINVRGCLITLALLSLAACSSVERRHGYVPPPQDLEQIVVGIDTRESIADSLGRPTISGILTESAWYYVESRFSAYGIRKRKEVDRQVVAISFDEDGLVENVERFGLEDGKIVALSRRVTDSNIKGVSFLQQLFGSIGNFAADQLVDN